MGGGNPSKRESRRSWGGWWRLSGTTTESGSAVCYEYTHDRSLAATRGSTMHYSFGRQGSEHLVDIAWQIERDALLARHILRQAEQAHERHGVEWEDHFASGDSYTEPVALLIGAAEQLDGWLTELIRVVREDHERRHVEDKRAEIHRMITEAVR
jgi:hypothetical protein